MNKILQKGYIMWSVVFIVILAVSSIVLTINYEHIKRKKETPKVSIMDTMYYHKDGTTGFCYSVIENEFKVSHARVPCDMVDDLLEE